MGLWTLEFVCVCVHTSALRMFVCMHLVYVCTQNITPGSHSHIPLGDQLLSTRSTQKVSVDANWRVVEVIKGLYLGYDWWEPITT